MPVDLAGIISPLLKCTSCIACPDPPTRTRMAPCGDSSPAPGTVSAMSDNNGLESQLLHYRQEIEAEIQGLRNQLTEKQKVLQSPDHVISMVRGTSPPTDTPPTDTPKRTTPVLRSHRLSLNKDRIKESIVDLLASGAKPHYALRDFYEHLKASGLIPEGYALVTIQNRIREILSGFPGAIREGELRNTTYRVK